MQLQDVWWKVNATNVIIYVLHCWAQIELLCCLGASSQSLVGGQLYCHSVEEEERRNGQFQAQRPLPLLQVSETVAFPTAQLSSKKGNKHSQCQPQTAASSSLCISSSP